MPAVAAVAGAQLLSTAVQANAANRAAKAQAGAADRATQVQWDMYNQTRQDQQPWQQAGQNALAQMMEQMGYGVNQLQPSSDGKVQNTGMYSFSATPNQNKLFQGFQADPGYQFRQQEGNKALQNRQAASGGYFSGNALRAAADYNSGLASQEYGNYWNRLAGLAGVGQQANATMANVGQNTAGNVGNNMIQAGNARASGYAARGQAFGNALSNLSNLGGEYLFTSGAG